MTTARGSRGDLIFFHDFGGAELPVAGTGAYAAAGGTPATVGPFKITGDLAENDTGTVSLAISNGALRISGNDEDGKGVAVGTEVIFGAALNGTLTLETRIQRQVMTAGVVWAGFVDVHADDVAEPLTATGTTLTLTASDLAGFFLDSQLTATADWHCPFNGGSVSGPTDSQVVVTGTTNDRNKNSVGVVTGVAGEYDLLYMEIFTNGTVRWYINEVLVQEQVNAVSTSVLLAGYVGCWGTTSTAADADWDYLDIRAKRNWAR